MSESPFDPIVRVHALGERAIRACDLAAAGAPWTPASLMAAANGLREGASSAGVRRPWPTIAKRIKVIAATWIVLYPAVKEKTS